MVGMLQIDGASPPVQHRPQSSAERRKTPFGDLPALSPAANGHAAGHRVMVKVGADGFEPSALVRFLNGGHHAIDQVTLEPARHVKGFKPLQFLDASHTPPSGGRSW